jgi:hypothetical protein
MDRSPDERITVPAGREICAGRRVKAMITGQIAPLGSHYVITLEAVNSRRAYQDFLALWKDADPEIPVLKEAKAEYAKLK